MNCLVVSAHPMPDSLCQHLAGHVMATLAARGRTVTHDDLYAQGFDPVLTLAERRGYYDAYASDGVQDHIGRLEQADCLVLVFPTWWFGFPAILKGWFDRGWAPGAAFDHGDDFGPISPRLDRLRHVVAITPLGSPW